MLTNRSGRMAMSCVLFTLPGFAFAHSGHNDSGLMAGVIHPLSGMDHLLAMFAVGLWAAQQKGSARWSFPTTFVGCMLLGGLLGFDGVYIPYLETGIAASVVTLGLLVALVARTPLVVSILITGSSGLVHGIAHGLELPGMSSPVAYAAGFVIATSGLHALGYALSRFPPACAAALIRIIGLVSAGVGALLLVG